MKVHNLFVRELKALDMADNLEAIVQVQWQFVNNLKQPIHYHAVEYFFRLIFVNNNFIFASGILFIISYIPLHIQSRFISFLL
jgi:hypothetical protein